MASERPDLYMEEKIEYAKKMNNKVRPEKFYPDELNQDVKSMTNDEIEKEIILINDVKMLEGALNKQGLLNITERENALLNETIRRVPKYGGKKKTKRRTTKKNVKKTVKKTTKKRTVTKVKKAVRCSAKTAEGKRCKHNTTTGKRCGHHRR